LKQVAAEFASSILPSGEEKGTRESWDLLFTHRTWSYPSSRSFATAIFEQGFYTPWDLEMRA